MRSYKSKEDFFFKIKKKPAQQAVIDNIQNYTIEDIDSLSGPHFPIWVKDGLKAYKNRNGRSSSDIALEIANQMIMASQKQQ